MTLRGLTWDHPRAYQPLQAFATHRPDLAVSWDRQSLADVRGEADRRAGPELRPDDHRPSRAGRGHRRPGHPAAGPTGARGPACRPGRPARSGRPGPATPWSAGQHVGGADRRGHPGVGVPARPAAPAAPARLGRGAWPGPAAPDRAVPGRAARVPHPAGHVRARPAPPRAAARDAPAGRCSGPATRPPRWASCAPSGPRRTRRFPRPTRSRCTRPWPPGPVAYCPLAYGYASYARPARRPPRAGLGRRPHVRLGRGRAACSAAPAWPCPRRAAPTRPRCAAS